MHYPLPSPSPLGHTLLQRLLLYALMYVHLTTHRHATAAAGSRPPTRLRLYSDAGRVEAVDDFPGVDTAAPDLVARWNEAINDLPSQGMPPGPIAGNGDLGLALQTGANGSGAVELWLGLNQFSGAPNRSEAFGGRSVADLIADRNFTNGPDGTLQQTTPFPRIVALGGVTIASDYFAGKAVRVDAAQCFSNGTLTAQYTRLGSGETLTTRSVLDPDANRVATSVTVCAAKTDTVRINITTWTTTLFVNATPAAAAWTTQAGVTSEGVQHFGRQPIPENPGRVVDGYRGAVATQIIGGVENSSRRHRVLFNATAAEAAGLPTDGVPIGAETQLTLSHGGSSQTADSSNLQCASLTVITTALTNLDLGDLRLDPLPTLLRNTNQSASEVAATALDIQRRCNRTWAQWWIRSKVSLSKQPTLQEFWTVAQYMLFSTAKPIGSSAVRALGAAVGPIWGPWTTSDDSGWANGAYVTDYNMMAPLYGALSSNHADSMLSYFAAVEAFAHRHGRAGAIATAKWTELRDTERNAAVAAAAAGGADVGPGRNLSQCMLSSEAIHLPCGIGPRGHLSGGNGPSPFGDWKQRWCGVYTALPFLWYYEYTRNATFGRERLLPLLRGLGAFWRCWLVRVPNATSGNYVLGDFEDSVGEQGWYSGCSEELGCRIDWPWSPANNPSGCCIRWRDPIFATAQNRRLFSSLGALARELNEPEEAWWQEIVAHLPPLTVGPNTFNDTTWLMAADRMPRGTSDRHWLGAFTSGMFGGMWPVHPAETVDADSAPAEIAMARATARSLFIVEEQSVAVQFFPPAVRASIDMETPIPCGVDWTHRPNETNPTPLLRCLKLWLQWTTSYGATPPDRPWSPTAERINKFPYIVRPGQPYGCGGIEEIGTVDAINTMLLATTSGSGRDVLRLFPVWRRMQTAPDAAGPASFTRLLAKGGFEVSAEYDDATDLVSDVRVRSLAGMTCAIVSPWQEGKSVPSQPPPRVVRAGNTAGDVAVAVRWVVDDRFNRSVFEFNTTAGETYIVGA